MRSRAEVSSTSRTCMPTAASPMPRAPTPRCWARECIGGALYISDFIRICHDVGFASPREVSSRPIAVDNPELRALTGEAHFSSITFRCFKAEGLERTAEDYGHVAVYRGGVVGAGSVFVLDSTNAFEKDRPRLVCGNTATMLASSRFAPFFTVTGSHATHFGAFRK